MQLLVKIVIIITEKKNRFVGPLSSILSVKYSYRTVTLIGGTFAAVGMILSFWASSVTYLYIR